MMETVPLVSFLEPSLSWLPIFLNFLYEYTLVGLPADWGCPCALPFLSPRVFGDLFSLFVLMVKILITRLQDP